MGSVYGVQMKQSGYRERPGMSFMMGSGTGSHTHVFLVPPQPSCNMLLRKKAVARGPQALFIVLQGLYEGPVNSLQSDTYGTDRHIRTHTLFHQKLTGTHTQRPTLTCITGLLDEVHCFYCAHTCTHTHIYTHTYTHTNARPLET
jgi:hypothetical protein